jgi:hypothetical protein
LRADVAEVNVSPSFIVEPRALPSVTCHLRPTSSAAP